jgi:hypothetical protein
MMRFAASYRLGAESARLKFFLGGNGLVCYPNREESSPDWVDGLVEKRFRGFIAAGRLLRVSPASRAIWRVHWRKAPNSDDDLHARRDVVGLNWF